MRHLVILALVMAPVLAESPELSYYWPYSHQDASLAIRMAIAGLLAGLVRLLAGSMGNTPLVGRDRWVKPLLTSVIAGAGVWLLSLKLPNTSFGQDYLVGLITGLLGEALIITLVRRQIPQAIVTTIKDSLVRWAKGDRDGSDKA